MKNYLNYKYIYIVGIGGSGMSTLARYLKWQGLQVFGYDAVSTTLTKQLEKEGIKINYVDEVECIPKEISLNKADSLILYTTAIPVSNKTLQHLNNNKYTLIKRKDVYGDISKKYFTIGIAGTHGKTITTALISHIVYNSKIKMMAFLGGIAKEYNSNFITNCSPDEVSVMIIEADEYDRFFLSLKTDISIVTTADPDHLDVYHNKKNFHDAFTEFISNSTKTGYSILHKHVFEELNPLMHSYPELNKKKILCYALNNELIRAENLSTINKDICFDYVNGPFVIENIKLPLVGLHNVENTLAVITSCLKLKLEPNEIKNNIASFAGVNRRFNVVLESKKIVFIDDFAHHPVEIEALVSAIRLRYPNKKITLIFQPHTYTRTRDFCDGFAQSLDKADTTILLDIYPAREAPIDGIDSSVIFNKMKITRKYLCNKNNLVNFLESINEIEILVTVGAGDISDLVEPIAFVLKERK